MLGEMVREKDQVQKTLEAWAREPVHLTIIDSAGMESLLKNPSDKLLLLNLWSMSSQNSVQEFSEFIKINRMYRDRDFELITLCVDGTGDMEKTLKFLQTQQASNANFMANRSNWHVWIKSVNPGWQGDLPCTLLIEPSGKIVYAKEGLIDAAELKRTIVNNHLIGRYP